MGEVLSAVCRAPAICASAHDGTSLATWLSQRGVGQPLLRAGR